MNYFFDTEFNERGPQYPLELISIGMVCDDGRELYEVSTDFNVKNCNEFVQKEVLPRLDCPIQAHNTPEFIAAAILDFVGDDKKPMFIGAWADYDWVIFCQLFGSMDGKPHHFPYYCKDIVQMRDDCLAMARADAGAGVQLKQVSWPKKPKDAHNSLVDARWTMKAYNKIKEHYQL